MHLPKEKLVDIAGELEMRMICFIHCQTAELISYPQDEDFGGYFLEEENPWRQYKEKVNSDRSNYIEIEPMPSSIKYKLMEDFANTIKDNWLHDQLIKALTGKKPFAHFNALIHQVSESHKKAWFAFKQEKTVEWIKDQLLSDQS